MVELVDNASDDDEGEQTRRICNFIVVCSFGTSMERIVVEDVPFDVRTLYEEC